MATFIDAIFESARMGRFASTGTCSAVGTLTTLIDAELRDHATSMITRSIGPGP